MPELQDIRKSHQKKSLWFFSGKLRDQALGVRPLLHTSLHCPMYTGHYTLYDVYCKHCILYTMYCILQRVRCTLHTMHRILLTVHCMLYSIHCILDRQWPVMSFITAWLDTAVEWWWLYTAHRTVYSVQCALCPVFTALHCFALHHTGYTTPHCTTLH